MKYHGLSGLMVLLSTSQGLNVLNGSTLEASLRRRDENMSTVASENFTLPTLALPSADGFRSTKIWGPPTWFFLHSMTLALPEEVPKEQQLHMKNMLVALSEVLPCSLCSENWRQNMKEDPVDPHLGHRSSMVDWMIRMHNKVNALNHQPLQTRDEVLEEYQLAYDKFGRYGGYQAVLGPRSYSSSWKSSWFLVVLALLGSFHQL